MSRLSDFIKSFDKKEDTEVGKAKDIKVNNVKINLDDISPAKDEREIDSETASANKDVSVKKENDRPISTDDSTGQNKEQLEVNGGTKNTSANKTSTKIDLNSREFIENLNRLFIESETSIEYKDEWVEMYKKGLRSRNKNQTVRKIINGRFRILSGGRMEILSDMKTHNMKNSDILNSKWL